MADEEEEESDWSLKEVEEELRSNCSTLSNLIFFHVRITSFAQQARGGGWGREEEERRYA